MRILITYGRRPPYPPFGRHLVRAFRALGHAAVLLPVRDRPLWAGYVKRLPAPWKHRWQWDPVEWANHILLNAAARYRPEAMLEIGHDLFTPTTLRTIRQRWGTRLGVWLVEGPFRGEPHPVLAEYDRITSTSMVAVEQLRRAGLQQATYLAFATDPEYFCPGPQRGDEPRHRLGFIGAYSPRRETVLEPVSDLGLCLWGYNWDTKSPSAALRQCIRAPRGIFGRGVVRSYQSTAVMINIQREHMTTLAASGQRIGTGLGWRHFDVPACGSLLLSESILELPEAFVVGEEIETFSTPEELREKAGYLLSHDARRKAMIQRARGRVLQEHTYIQRAQQWLRWFRSNAPAVSLCEADSPVRPAGRDGDFATLRKAPEV